MPKGFCSRGKYLIITLWKKDCQGDVTVFLTCSYRSPSGGFDFVSRLEISADTAVQNNLKIKQRLPGRKAPRYRPARTAFTLLLQKLPAWRKGAVVV